VKTCTEQKSLESYSIAAIRSPTLTTRGSMKAKGKLSLISEGQQKQVGVLGPEATVKLRQFELMLDTVAKFGNAHPEVFTAALANAQKFVPNVQVGTGGEGVTGMLAAILGQTLAGGTPLGANPTQSRPAQTQPAR
jgi:hypothetical protein